VVDIKVYQGEDDDAFKNLLVGDFRIDGLTTTEEQNEVLCRMSLDIDGILNVTAIEKETGKKKSITITNALTPKTEAEIADARKRSQEFFATRVESESEDEEDSENDGDSNDESDEEGFESEQETHPALEVVERSKTLMGRMHPDDAEEAVSLNERVHAAVQAGNEMEVEAAVEKLRELIFFVESR
jgi:molecular chaperone DnaK